MRAMVVKEWCEPKDMELMELPDPQPGPGQVAIDVRAIGCNFFDILIAQGKYQVRPPLAARLPASFAPSAPASTP